MTGADLLPDTNAVVAWNKNVVPVLRMIDRSSSVSISLFTLGELYFGARKSERVEANLEGIAGTLQEVHLLLPDKATADVYGLLKNRLRIRARPVPENDLWIAALALQHDLVLATRDGHFDHVQDLRRISW